MPISKRTNEVLQGLRVRAEDACVRAQVMRTQATAARTHAVEAAVRLSLVHENLHRLRGGVLVEKGPEPLAQDWQHKKLLAVALQEEQAALRAVDRMVRTQWLLQKSAAANGERGCVC